MAADVILRLATESDIPEILRQRRLMYQDMGEVDPSGLDAMAASSAPYIERSMADRSLHAWLACADGDTPVGGGLVIVQGRLSRPYFPECREASILNVYVYPEYRRRGIARRLMLAMIEWCREEGFPHVSLHASNQARLLYESLGFQPTSELRLKLR